MAAKNERQYERMSAGYQLDCCVTDLACQLSRHRYECGCMEWLEMKDGDCIAGYWTCDDHRR